MTTLILHVNGQDVQLPEDSNATLQFALRDDLGLTGTKFGCGAWPVRLLHGAGGRPAGALLPDASHVGGRQEHHDHRRSRRRRSNLHPLQQAWIDAQAPQCGYCQPGQIMEASALLQRNPAPSDADIRQALNGHLCRCGTYNRIVQAVQLAAARMNGSQA